LADENVYACCSGYSTLAATKTGTGIYRIYGDMLGAREGSVTCGTHHFACILCPILSARLAFSSLFAIFCYMVPCSNIHVKASQIRGRCVGRAELDGIQALKSLAS
jgi:hypothetical protein